MSVREGEYSKNLIFSEGFVQSALRVEGKVRLSCEMRKAQMRGNARSEKPEQLFRITVHVPRVRH